MKYLVTGAAGFLGKHMLKQLTGHEVLGGDNFEPNCGADPETVGDVAHLDVTNYGEVLATVSYYKPDAIIHLAALGRNLTCQNDPIRAWEVNVDGTRNILHAALECGTKRVVCCSSNITLSPEPTVYKSTKLAVEALVAMYHSLGVSCMGLRPTNIYGPGQSRTEFQPCAFAMLDTAYENQGYFKITGDGTQTRDWVHAKDVARAFHLAAESEVSGISLDVATGKQISMNDLARMLDVNIEYVPARPGDAKALVSDPESTEQILGFKYEVELNDAIFDAFPSIPKRNLIV